MDNSIKSFSIINLAVMKKSYTEAMIHVSQIVTYVHSKRERTSIGAAAVDEKARLLTKQC